MAKVILGPSHTSGKDRKYHRQTCRYAPDDPGPLDVFDEPDARVWARRCRECFGGDIDG